MQFPTSVLKVTTGSRLPKLTEWFQLPHCLSGLNFPSLCWMCPLASQQCYELAIINHLDTTNTEIDETRLIISMLLKFYFSPVCLVSQKSSNFREPVGSFQLMTEVGRIQHSRPMMPKYVSLTIKQTRNLQDVCFTFHCYVTRRVRQIVRLILIVGF